MEGRQCVVDVVGGAELRLDAHTSGAAGEREDGAAFLPTLAFAGGLASVFVGFGLSASLVGGVFGTAGSGSVFGALLLASLSSGVSIAMGLQLLDIIRIPLPSFDIDVPSLGKQCFGRGRRWHSSNCC